MSGFLYFVPGMTAVGVAEVKSIGLAGAKPKHYEQGPVNEGPGGGSGTFIRASLTQGKLGYNAAAQTWVAGPDKKYYVGFETACPPGPDDLSRDRMVPGADVELADGKLWHVPIARHSYSDTIPITLPQTWGVNAEGEDEFKPAKDAEALWKAGCDLWEAFMGTEPEGKEPLTYEDEFDYACLALATNYHLGQLEIKALGLIRTDNQNGISKVLFDLVGFEAVVAEMDAEESGAEGNADDISTG